MVRHAGYIPHGVIPAVLLPFENDLSIDEVSFRKHLRDVASVEGLSAITINAHSTEVASCTFDEQKRVLDIAQDEVGDRLPLITASGPMARSRRLSLRAWRRRPALRRLWYFRRRRSRWDRTPRWRSRISSASPTQQTCR
jgi:hypothetical protein